MTNDEFDRTDPMTGTRYKLIKRKLTNSAVILGWIELLYTNLPSREEFFDLLSKFVEEDKYNWFVLGSENEYGHTRFSCLEYKERK